MRACPVLDTGLGWGVKSEEVNGPGLRATLIRDQRDRRAQVFNPGPL